MLSKKSLGDNFPFDRYDEIVDVMHKKVWYFIYLFLVQMFGIYGYFYVKLEPVNCGMSGTSTHTA